MGRRSFFVARAADDGGVRINPFKQWLRDNPQHIPTGLSATSTITQQLARALKAKGWSVIEGIDRVFLVMPGDQAARARVSEWVESDSGQSLEGEENDSEESPVRFGLERDLQSALRANIQQLERGLVIIDEGTERATEAGRIDITAKYTEGNLVIVELKAGTASMSVVGQILAYMGALNAPEGKAVRGILVAGDFDRRVLLAARRVPNLQLRTYSFQFTFRSAQ